MNIQTNAARVDNGLTVLESADGRLQMNHGDAFTMFVDTHASIHIYGVVSAQHVAYGTNATDLLAQLKDGCLVIRNQDGVAVNVFLHIAKEEAQ